MLLCLSAPPPFLSSAPRARLPDFHMTLYDVVLGVLFWSVVVLGVFVASVISFGVPIALVVFAVRYFKEKRHARAVALLFAAVVWLSMVALYFLLPWESLLATHSSAATAAAPAA